MNNDIFTQIENMSDEDKQALLGTQFPEELEKEAEAEVDNASLADSLYSYGWMSAERAVAEEEGLDKFAAEDVQAHEQAEKELGDAIETLITSVGTADAEDEAELHKEAQAAASIIFEGYTDCIEKLAKDKAGIIKSVSKKLHEGMKAAKSAAKAGMKKVEKGAKGAAKGAHRVGMKGGYGAVGGAGALYLGTKAKQKLEKKASDLTFGEIYDMVFEKMAGDAEVIEGMDKIAKRGVKKALTFIEKAKGFAGKAHKAGKKGLYAGLGGAAAGFAAGKASDKE